MVLSQVWAKGGEGGVELAKEVVRLCEEENNFQYAYPLESTIKTTIELTNTMKEIFPSDPVKSDFALFGLGVDI